jgi:hypothetical protein
MHAVVARKQPGKCNLHVEDPIKVAEILLSRLWPPMRHMWRDFYKLESYLIVTAFHNPTRLLSQRQGALTVLLDLYSAKMLVREITDPIMPEIRETRLVASQAPDLHRALYREHQRLAAHQDTVERVSAFNQPRNDNNRSTLCLAPIMEGSMQQPLRIR